MDLVKLFFRAQRYHRDLKAIMKGRIAARLYNRGVSRVLRMVKPKLYK